MPTCRLFQFILVVAVSIITAQSTCAQETNKRLKEADEFSKTKIVRIDGTNVSLAELKFLRNQRRLADSFFRMAMTKIRIQVEREKLALRKALKEMSKRPNNQFDAPKHRSLSQRQELLIIVATEIERKLDRNHIFEPGDSVDDLVDFMLWQREAKRLKIQLTTDAVWVMAKKAVFLHVVSAEKAWDDVFVALKKENNSATKAALVECIRNEFSVRIARSAKTRGLQMIPGDSDRLPLSPSEMWADFQKQRTEWDIAILPIRARRFLDLAPNPSKQQLQEFFDKHRNTLYNPATIEPGLKLPARVKIEWVTADPRSERYRAEAKAQYVNLLQSLISAPPVNVIPLAPAWAALRPTVITSAMESALLKHDYEKRKERMYSFGTEYSPAKMAFEMAMYKVARQIDVESNWTYEERKAALTIKKPIFDFEKGGKKFTWTQAHSAIFATWVFGCARAETVLTSPMIGNAAIYTIHEKELQPILQEAHEKYSRRKFVKNDGSDVFLPFQLVAAELRERRIEKNAKANAARVMEKVYSELDTVFRAEVDKGKLNPQARIRPVIDDMVKHFGLSHGHTKKFYSKYDIGESPELLPLKQAFEQADLSSISQVIGSGQNVRIWPDYFYRLFIDGSSNLEWAKSRYAVKNWPPVVHLRKSKWEIPKKTKKDSIPVYLLPQFLDQRFLFWRTDERESAIAKTIEEVGVLAQREWKERLAFRTLAIPYAATIAEKAIRDRVDVHSFMNTKAGEIDEKLLILPRVAHLYAISFDQFSRFYLVFSKLFVGPRTGFELEIAIRKICNHPRHDLGAQIVQLIDLAQPIKTGIPNVDSLNKKLFSSYMKRGGKSVVPIQITANQPQSELYILTAIKRYPAGLGEFLRSYQSAASDRFIRDGLVDILQGERGEQFRKSLHEQLRRKYRVEWLASPEVRKRFDIGK